MKGVTCFRLDWDLDTDVWTLALVDDADTLYMEVLRGNLGECIYDLIRRVIDINQNREEAGA